MRSNFYPADDDVVDDPVPYNYPDESKIDARVPARNSATDRVPT